MTGLELSTINPELSHVTDQLEQIGDKRGMSVKAVFGFELKQILPDACPFVDQCRQPGTCLQQLTVPLFQHLDARGDSALSPPV